MNKIDLTGPAGGLQHLVTQVMQIDESGKAMLRRNCSSSSRSSGMPFKGKSALGLIRESGSALLP